MRSESRLPQALSRRGVSLALGVNAAMRYWKFGLAGAVIDVAVLAASLGLYGAGSAARNTARFAVLIFLAAFAAPGLRRWLHVFEPAPLIIAYVSAQMVHYCAVALLHTAFAGQPM